MLEPDSSLAVWKRTSRVRNEPGATGLHAVYKAALFGTVVTADELMAKHLQLMVEEIIIYVQIVGGQYLDVKFRGKYS